MTFIPDKLKNAALHLKQKIEPAPRDEESILRDELRETKRQINMAYSQFNGAIDKDNISYYTYLIKAFETKYAYLIKKAKEMEVKIS